MTMDEDFSVSSIIDKLPPSWKDYKHNLKHQNDEMNLVQLGSHLRIEEGLRVQEGDVKGKSEIGQPQVHMVESDKNNHVNHKNNRTRNRLIQNSGTELSFLILENRIGTNLFLDIYVEKLIYKTQKTESSFSSSSSLLQ